jgi:hypothetical protein
MSSSESDGVNWYNVVQGPSLEQGDVSKMSCCRWSSMPTRSDRKWFWNR